MLTENKRIADTHT